MNFKKRRNCLDLDCEKRLNDDFAIGIIDGYSFMPSKMEYAILRIYKDCLNDNFEIHHITKYNYIFYRFQKFAFAHSQSIRMEKQKEYYCFYTKIFFGYRRYRYEFKEFKEFTFKIKKSDIENKNLSKVRLIFIKKILKQIDRIKKHIIHLQTVHAKKIK